MSIITEHFRAALQAMDGLTEAQQGRLAKYGELYRETLPSGKATVVVRGIFQARKGDSYHVRVLRGEGKPSDETKKGEVLWKTDVYDFNDKPISENPEAALKHAVSLAKDWAKSKLHEDRLVEAAKPTYQQARDALFAYLRKEGWKVNDTLKVPYATNPDGNFRLWFKAQAVYATNADPMGASSHSFKNARSITGGDKDIRALTPEEFVKYSERWVEEHDDLLDNKKLNRLIAEAIETRQRAAK